MFYNFYLINLFYFCKYSTTSSFQIPKFCFGNNNNEAKGRTIQRTLIQYFKPVTQIRTGQKLEYLY